MECKIRFSDVKLKEAFESLKETDARLHKEISKALTDIETNIFTGRNVKKKIIPKEYAKKYKIDNMRICNLRKDWRLFYTVGKGEVKIIAIVLDWMNHKDYERLFRF